MHRATRTTNRFTLCLTALEARDCPGSAVVYRNTLYVTTDPSSEIVRLRDDGRGGVSVSIDGAQGRTTAAGAGIGRIVVHARGGHDQIDYRLTGALRRKLDIRIDLGPDGGGDQVRLDFRAGVAGGALSVDVSGKAGRGSVLSDLGPVRNGSAYFRQHLADGPARFHTRLLGPLNNAKVVVG